MNNSTDFSSVPVDRQATDKQFWGLGCRFAKMLSIQPEFDGQEWSLRSIINNFLKTSQPDLTHGEVQKLFKVTAVPAFVTKGAKSGLALKVKSTKTKTKTKTTKKAPAKTKVVESDRFAEIEERFTKLESLIVSLAKAK